MRTGSPPSTSTRTSDAEISLCSDRAGTSADSAAVVHDEIEGEAEMTVMAVDMNESEGKNVDVDGCVESEPLAVQVHDVVLGE